MLSGMRAQLAVISAVSRSPALRRIEGGFLLFSIGEWASWLAIVVYAFGRGGATEAGIVGFVIGVPSIVVAPGAALLGDRWPRARVLLASYVLQAAAMAATAASLLWGPPPLAYAFATIAATTIGLSRPALSSLLPEVVETPDQLTAANVVSGIAEGAGALAGPLLAGVLLGISGAPAVFAATTIGALLAALALAPIARTAAAIPREAILTDAAGSTRGMLRALGRELAGGAAAVAADRRLGGILVVLAAAIALLGALGVFTVVIAIDLLGLDDAAVGFLTAASGLGALVGSATSVVLVGRARLGRPLIIAAVAFGLAVAVLGIVRAPLLVTVVFVISGIGWSFAYVAATTLTQRLAGDDVMTRVFGITESVMAAAEAVGGLLVPLLIFAFGPSGAIVVAGLALPVVALLAAPTFLRADRAETQLLRELRVIRSVPMFRPLAGPVLERLAADAVPLAFLAGQTIVTAGHRGDRFYMVVSGRSEVVVADVVTGSVGPGDAFGEIALIHDIPRTATVRAIEDVEVLGLERDAFLEALTGQPRSRAIATQVAVRHLAHDPGPVGGGTTTDPPEA